MATITPTLDLSISGVPRVIWSGVSTADTMEPYKLTNQVGIAGAIQITGTWGGSTVSLHGSCDGTTYFQLEDVLGNAISDTANNMREFSTSAAYVKPISSGGTADNVDVVLVLRGPTTNV